MTLCRADEAPETDRRQPGGRVGRRWRRLASSLRRVGRPLASRRPASPGAAPLAPADGAPRRRAPALRWRNPERAPGGDFAALAIGNAALTRAMVPGPGDQWEAVSDFCLSYDGHAYWADLPELANQALQRWTRDGTVPDSLDELRGCLFYEQRRWHHLGDEPGDRSSRYLRELVAAVRDLLPPDDVAPAQSDLGSRASDPTPPARRGRPALVDPRVRIAPEAHVRIIASPSDPQDGDGAPSHQPGATPAAVGTASGRVVPLRRAAEEEGWEEAKARHPATRQAARRPSPDGVHLAAVVTELRPMPSAEALAKPPVIARRAQGDGVNRERNAAVVATLHPIPVGAEDRRVSTGDDHDGRRRDGVGGNGEATVFDHDDEGYRTWLASHPRGFVLNARTSTAPGASVLHHARCSAIATTAPHPTANSAKVCGDSSLALVRWSNTRGGTPACCRRCFS